MRITIETFGKVDFSAVAEIMDGINHFELPKEVDLKRCKKDVWEIKEYDYTTYIRKTQKGYAIDIHRGIV